MSYDQTTADVLRENARLRDRIRSLEATPARGVVTEAEALVKVALPDFKWAAWLLLHAAKQGVNEHRSMMESQSVITQHIARIERALTEVPDAA
jgi:hypothetical protein